MPVQKREAGDRSAARSPVHVCLVYDLLFPYTIGGAERWYRNLAERLAAEGHRVTYLTLRHWPDGEAAEVPGVEVVPVGAKLELYTASGRRRIVPPLRFGFGVLRHLTRAGAALRRRPYRLVPLLLPARGRAGPATTRHSASSSIGSRSGRASTGASTWDRSAGASAGGATPLHPRTARGFLLLAAVRHDGCRSRACEAMSRSRGHLRRPARHAAGARRAGRRLRGAPHPREAGDCTRAGDRACARARSPSSAGEIFGDGPARPRYCA